jgi:hypothetical protein
VLLEAESVRRGLFYVPVLDLNRNDIFVDPTHLNRSGQQLIGERVSEAVLACLRDGKVPLAVANSLETQLQLSR